jgi:predicted nucleic acid-binding protein
MINIVIDTSVVIAVLLNEPEKQRLIKLTLGNNLVSPSSLPWEIGNALSLAFRKKRLSDIKVAHVVLKEFVQIPIQLIDIQLKDAIDICYHRGIYAYDAYMIACAQQYRLPLLTLDKRLSLVAKEEKIRVLEV